MKTTPKRRIHWESFTYISSRVISDCPHFLVTVLLLLQPHYIHHTAPCSLGEGRGPLPEASATKTYDVAGTELDAVGNTYRKKYVSYLPPRA